MLWIKSGSVIVSKSKNTNRLKTRLSMLGVLTAFLANLTIMPVAVYADTPLAVIEAENLTRDAAPAVPGPMKLNPAADTWISQTNRTTNYGADTLLHADADAPTYTNTVIPTANQTAAEHAVLRFNLGTVPNSIYSAKLRLKVANSTPGTFRVGPVTTCNPYGNGGCSETGAWSESEYKFGNYYSNLRFETDTVVVNGQTGPVGSWVEIDISRFAQAYVGRNLTMGIETDNADGVYFYSKESAYKPELNITFAGSTMPYVINDPAASGGKAMKFDSNASASGTFTIPSGSNTAYGVSVIGRGEGVTCTTAPGTIVEVDGKPIRTFDLMFFLEKSTYDISYGSTDNTIVPSGIAPGTHTVKISYVNDQPFAPGCDRNAIVDKIQITPYW